MDTIILDWDKLVEKTGAEDNVNITAYQEDEDIEGNPWKLAIKSI